MSLVYVSVASGRPRRAAAVIASLAVHAADDAAGLASGGTADRIWMERGTVGAAFEF